MRHLRSFLKETSGATAIEYGLIAAIIASALIVGLGSFSGVLSNMFNGISDLLVTSMQ